MCERLQEKFVKASKCSQRGWRLNPSYPHLSQVIFFELNSYMKKSWTNVLTQPYRTNIVHCSAKWTWRKLTSWGWRWRIWEGNERGSSVPGRACRAGRSGQLVRPGRAGQGGHAQASAPFWGVVSAQGFPHLAQHRQRRKEGRKEGILVFGWVPQIPTMAVEVSSNLCHPSSNSNCCHLRKFYGSAAVALQVITIGVALQVVVYEAGVIE